MEIWINMSNEHRNYAISNLGNVKNVRTGKVLKNSIDQLGYPRVNINKKCWRIHTLVCIYFIRQFESKECCNHIDGNKKNNKLDNLEITSYRENNIHAYRLGLRFPPKGVPRKAIEASILKNIRPVCLIDKDGNIIKEFPSIKKAKEDLGISNSHIGDVASGKRKSINGMFFIYKNIE